MKPSLPQVMTIFRNQLKGEIKKGENKATNCHMFILPSIPENCRHMSVFTLGSPVAFLTFSCLLYFFLPGFHREIDFLERKWKVLSEKNSHSGIFAF